MSPNLCGTRRDHPVELELDPVRLGVEPSHRPIAMLEVYLTLRDLFFFSASEQSIYHNTNVHLPVHASTSMRQRRCRCLTITRESSS